MVGIGVGLALTIGSVATPADAVVSFASIDGRSSGEWPGLTTANLRALGALPVALLTRTCTWSTLPTTYGSVPGVACLDSADPASGWSSLRPRVFQPDQTPFVLVRSCIASAGGVCPVQVTPATA